MRPSSSRHFAAGPVLLAGLILVLPSAAHAVWLLWNCAKLSCPSGSLVIVAFYVALWIGVGLFWRWYYSALVRGFVRSTEAFALGNPAQEAFLGQLDKLTTQDWIAVSERHGQSRRDVFSAILIGATLEADLSGLLGERYERAVSIVTQGSCASGHVGNAREAVACALLALAMGSNITASSWRRLYHPFREVIPLDPVRGKW